MADTKLSPLDQLDVDITEALGELRGARESFAHCPSSDNLLTLQYAGMRLDRLLDRRCAASAVTE